MTKYTLADAMGNICDRHIIESALYQRKSKSKAWIKTTVAAAACAAVLLMTIPIYNFITKNNAPDPFWAETHLRFTSAEKAVNEFGDDLLLDKIVVEGYYANVYEEYTLEFADGDSKTRSNWENIECFLIYYEDRVWGDFDNLHFYCNIAFSDENIGIFNKDSDKFYHKVSEETINGVYIEYGEHIEIFNGKSYYSEHAHFIYNDLNYYISCHTPDLLSDNHFDVLQLVIDTVRQMLS